MKIWFDNYFVYLNAKRKLKKRYILVIIRSFHDNFCVINITKNVYFYFKPYFNGLTLDPMWIE